MEILIKKNSPLNLREQIKRQIKMLIDGGHLQAGDPLPSARDLASLIKVNRNTITQAYKELAVGGVLDVIVGSGTFVKEGLIPKPKKALNRIFDKAVHDAGRIGFSLDEVTEYFLNRLSALSDGNTKKHVLVVDCNDEVINYLCQRLTDQLGVITEGARIQMLEERGDAAVEYLDGKDLVVCGFNHLEELKRVFPESAVEVVGVLLQVDARVINILTQLPAGTRVGYVCANQRSTETLYNSSYFSGGKELRRILAGYNNPAQLQKVIEACDIVFATHFIHEQVSERIRPHQKLIKVNIAIDASSLDFIKERLFQPKTMA
jgi:DNA-binding transcriptional regulator YhcF (GntR family)